MKGWLTRELKYLSGENTINLRRLAYLVQTTRPRLRERLVLYSIISGSVFRLKGYIFHEALLKEIDSVRALVGISDLTGKEIRISSKLPQRYRKAISSYISAYNTPETVRDSKILRWKKTVKLQKEKGLSNSEIYRALSLDAGNINAYLKHGDVGRVTVATATEVMKYLMGSPRSV
ncbi:MAG: hypothetical protein LBR00_00520 [Clostridiales Family XIII bacterium]|jgi:hypothetical protein|nr:hypothetical protein [Clostridiales Family XIII bacterium]